MADSEKVDNVERLNPSNPETWGLGPSNVSEHLDAATRAKTAYVVVQPSAFAGQFYLKWECRNGSGFAMRVNPLGPDLQEALAEFAKQCRLIAERS